jgi:hypothetical protein
MSESNTNNPTKVQHPSPQEVPPQDVPVYYAESAEGRYLVYIETLEPRQ